MKKFGLCLTCFALSIFGNVDFSSAQSGEILSVKVHSTSSKNPISKSSIEVSGISIDGAKIFVGKDKKSYEILDSSGSTMSVRNGPGGWSPGANPGDKLTREGETIKVK